MFLDIGRREDKVVFVKLYLNLMVNIYFLRISKRRKLFV